MKIIFYTVIANISIIVHINQFKVIQMQQFTSNQKYIIVTNKSI